MGIGQDGIRAAFGSLFIPAPPAGCSSTQRELYDVAGSSTCPPGTAHRPGGRPGRPRAYLEPEQEPRPELDRTERTLASARSRDSDRGRGLAAVAGQR